MKLEECVAPPPPDDAACHYCGIRATWQFFWQIVIAEGEDVLHMFFDQKPVYVCERHIVLYPVVAQRYITPIQFLNEMRHVEKFQKYWRRGNRLERLVRNMLAGLGKPNSYLYIGRPHPMNWDEVLKDIACRLL